MIGFNPTPELRNYSHIIMQNIKAIIIKINSKLKTQRIPQIVTSEAFYRADNLPIARYLAATSPNTRNPKNLCLFGTPKSD